MPLRYPPACQLSKRGQAGPSERKPFQPLKPPIAEFADWRLVDGGRQGPRRGGACWGSALPRLGAGAAGRGDRRDLWPERFCSIQPTRTPSALCRSRPTAPTRAPAPTVILPARQLASLLPCRRMRGGLRPSGSRCRDASCLERLDSAGNHVVTSPVLQDLSSLVGRPPSPLGAKRVGREIRSRCAAQRVGGAERPGPAREHVRRERISRSTQRHPAPQTGRTARTPFANSAIGVSSAWNSCCSGGLAFPLELACVLGGLPV
jgi:hypothetical protein